MMGERFKRPRGVKDRIHRSDPAGLAPAGMIFRAAASDRVERNDERGEDVISRQSHAAPSRLPFGDPPPLHPSHE
jgi:hypothetical protein